MASQPLPEPAEPSVGGEAMSDDELAALLAAQERQAVGYYTSEVAEEQAKAIDYYYGQPFGDEQEGRSQVVDRTVAVVIDNALAALLKPFVSSDESVSFQPQGPEDEAVAQQATEFVNYVFHVDNPGFAILHDWFKDALLSKLGVVKIWWHDKSRPKPETLTVDAMELEAIQEPIVEGPFETQTPGLYTVVVEREYVDGCVKIENVPPEEFLISPFARNVEEAPYLAHKTRKTRSELVELGFDPEIVASLSKWSFDVTGDQRSISRYYDEDQGGVGANFQTDKSQELIEVCHEFPLVDYDGDGVSERREIIRVGDKVLYNEEVESHPFAVLCPVPMPHKVYGLSLADQALQEQRIRSVLWRQALDNLYLANNPRPQVPARSERADGTTMDDLQETAPGAMIRVEQELPAPFTVPFVADKAFAMMDFAERQVTARTGVSMLGQGLDPNTLQKDKTATESAIEDNSRNVRVEMIARIFAETGVKALFRRILKLLIAHQPRERVIRLRNEWVPIDPRSWNAEMDVQISVGLGIGNRAEQAANMMQLLEVQERVALSPFAMMVSPQNVYATYKKLVNALGIKNVDDHITEPTAELMQQQPEKPDPETMKVQAEAQANAAKLQLEQQKAEADIMVNREKAQATLELEREKAALQAQLAREKADLEAQLAVEKMNREFAIAERRMETEAQLARESAAADRDAKIEAAKISTNRPGGDLSE